MSYDDPFHTFALDAFGNRVRIGLTFAETIEFDALNASEPTDAAGGLLPWHSQDAIIRRQEDRWFELYRKHEGARYALMRSRRPHMALSRSFAVFRGLSGEYPIAFVSEYPAAFNTVASMSQPSSFPQPNLTMGFTRVGWSNMVHSIRL